MMTFPRYGKMFQTTNQMIIHLNCFSTGVPQKGGSIAGMRSCIMFLFSIEFLRLMLAICLVLVAQSCKFQTVS
jgi:hypothetical protein